MAKLNPKANQSRLESDEYLDQVSLEELTDFFFETEVLTAFGKQGKKVARAMASYFIARNFLDLVVNEEFTKNTKTIFHLDDETFETITPEDYLIAKELVELIQDHYGIDNADVLLGKKDRRSFAKEMGIDYYAYCKRLNRLTSAFKQVLADAGYC